MEKGTWEIAVTASDKEKLKSEYADNINGLNSVGIISYETYSELFDVGMDLLDRMFEIGKQQLEKEK